MKACRGMKSFNTPHPCPCSFARCVASRPAYIIPSCQVRWLSVTLWSLLHFRHDHHRNRQQQCLLAIHVAARTGLSDSPPGINRKDRKLLMLGSKFILAEIVEYSTSNWLPLRKSFLATTNLIYGTACYTMWRHARSGTTEKPQRPANFNHTFSHALTPLENARSCID